MNFYLSLLDEKLKLEKDNYSIGLILCKSKNKIIAEYALKNFNRPIAVSGYNLPSKREIERELRKELEKS